MVIVQGVARVHPDDLDMLRAAAAIMVEASRAEPGCLAYAYAEDLGEPGVVHVIERWADQTALSTHFSTPHMARFNAALAKARLLGLKISAFDADGERVIAGR